jgi:poly(3-hydroxybutyrate) depolymerase
MALIRMDLHSDCLTRMVPVNVILPEKSDKRVVDNGKYPVLWLLHGATDDCSMWQRFTAVERYAQQRGLAVVMPSVETSFYANTDGGRYFDYVTEELPRMICSQMPVSPLREDNFVGGMSMGGSEMTASVSTSTNVSAGSRLSLVGKDGKVIVSFIVDKAVSQLKAGGNGTSGASFVVGGNISGATYFQQADQTQLAGFGGTVAK